LRILLNPVTSVEILGCFAGLPCSVVPFGQEESMTGLCEQRANLGISVIAKKIGPSDRRLVWERDPGHELPVVTTPWHVSE
jgi:hypothetical protein